MREGKQHHPGKRIKGDRYEEIRLSQSLEPFDRKRRRPRVTVLEVLEEKRVVRRSVLAYEGKRKKGAVPKQIEQSGSAKSDAEPAIGPPSLAQSFGRGAKKDRLSARATVVWSNRKPPPAHGRTSSCIGGRASRGRCSPVPVDRMAASRRPRRMQTEPAGRAEDTDERN